MPYRWLDMVFVLLAFFGCAFILSMMWDYDYIGKVFLSIVIVIAFAAFIVDKLIGD